MSVMYFNGTILTMDEACPQVEALLVGDGRIRKRGTLEAVSAAMGADDVRVDLDGKTMLPGFIDGHSHFSGFATALGQCDLSGARDFEDVARRMRAFIRENEIPEGRWVTGTNYDHNFLREGAHPDRTVLDSVSQAHPIVIVHASSHMGVANTLALKLQGLGRDAQDPDGGRYGRDAAGALNGYMEENAFVQFRNAMPMPDVEEILRLFARAQKIYAGYGVTTVQEGMVTEALFGILQCAERKRALYLDLVGYLDLENGRALLKGHPEYLGQYRHHFRIGGYKIFLDGSPQGRTAWMRDPYLPVEEGYCGYPIRTDDALYRCIRDALEDGQQLLAHCNGDAAAEQYISQFERVRAEHPECDLHRPVMIHAQLVREDQLARMAELPMTPSFFTAHSYYWGDVHIRNFGMARARKISPAGAALRLGLPFTFHQDSPVLKPDVLETAWCAAKRVTRAGVELAPEERVGVYEALKAATVWAARQYGEEADKGTIEEGKLADLVVLDRNPLAVPVDEVKDIRVLRTFKAGVEVYSKN